MSPSFLNTQNPAVVPASALQLLPLTKSLVLRPLRIALLQFVALAASDSIKGAAKLPICELYCTTNPLTQLP
jgi:hypothetical protein